MAVVSGAASGIGRATADKLHRDGYVTIGIDLAVDESSGSAQRGWQAHRCDVSDEAAVTALVSDIVERHGRIDVVANVAGVVLVKALVDTEWTEFRRLVEVNLGGTFLLCKYVIPAMQAQRSGVIVNVGSVSGHVGQIDHSLYGATKGGISALGRALAWELAPNVVSCRHSQPRFVDTPMLRGDIKLEASKTGKSVEEVKGMPRG